ARQVPPHGLPALRRGTAAERVAIPPSERCRSEIRAGHRAGRKGGKRSRYHFSEAATGLLEMQLLHVRTVLDADITLGRPGVSLPAALARKYPNARLEWGWQYVFPASRYSKEPRTRRAFRHHAYPSSLEKAIRKA